MIQQGSGRWILAVVGGSWRCVFWAIAGFVKQLCYAGCSCYLAWLLYEGPASSSHGIKLCTSLFHMCTSCVLVSLVPLQVGVVVGSCGCVAHQDCVLRKAVGAFC